MTSDFIKYSNGQNVRKLDYKRAEPRLLEAASRIASFLADGQIRDGIT